MYKAELDLAREHKDMCLCRRQNKGLSLKQVQLPSDSGTQEWQDEGTGGDSQKTPE